MYKMRKNTETTETTDLCLCNEQRTLLDNITGKDIYYKLITLRTGSGVTVLKIAKYIENSESVDWSKVYPWADKVPIYTKIKSNGIKLLWKNSNINLLMTYCQTDVGSGSGKLQIVQHVATVRHMMKITCTCFGHAVTRNSLGRISMTFVAGT